MSYAPTSIANLAAYWKAQGGVNLGIVGNTAHTVGYHLGKDRIYDGSGPGLGDRDYSVQLARDKAGLTNAAAAIDLGKLDGSITKLRKFSEWLVAQGRAGKLRDVKEIIYSTSDGVYVKRWSGPDNKVYTSLRKNPDGSITTITAGNGDASHFTHTHISFYRDSEGRAKVPYFAPYFEEVSDDMPAMTTYLPGSTVTVKPTANVRVAPTLTAKVIRVVGAVAEKWTGDGWVTGEVDPDGGSNQWYVRWNDGWEYTAKSNLTAGPTPAITAAQLDAAVKA
ncbi:MAG TPA: hypothetical protein VIU37_00210, partial [Candidatus Limnocylindrales bacterium]